MALNDAAKVELLQDAMAAIEAADTLEKAQQTASAAMDQLSVRDVTATFQTKETNQQLFNRLQLAGFPVVTVS